MFDSECPKILGKESPQGAVVNVFRSGIIVSNFKLTPIALLSSSPDYFGKGVNPLILPTMG